MAGVVGPATPHLVLLARRQNGRKVRKLTVGCLNVRGCGADEKKCMIADMFKERKMDVLALSETKVKGKGEREWESERLVVSGVSERCRAREGVAVMIKRSLWGSVVEYKCVSSRLLWVRMKVAGERIVIVGVYGPGMERSENEREVFWESLNECLSTFDDNERIVVLGDLNAKVGDRGVDGVIGKYGVPGVNENGERLVEVCIERRLSVGNTWFQKRMIQKYTRERENGQERSLIDYVLVDERSKRFLEDVNVYRGAAGGMSDHYLVEAIVRMKGVVKREREEVNGKRVVRVCELEKAEVREAFVVLIVNEWERIRNTRVLSVEEEWETFKSIVMACAARVCGYKSIGRKKQGSAWWDEEVKELVREKRRLFELYVTDRSERSREEYREKKQEVKRVTRQKKNESDERDGMNLSRRFRENKKLFWSDVNRKRKQRDQMSMKVRDSDGNMINEESRVKERWTEYFEWLLNVDDGRRAELTESGLEGIHEYANEEFEVSVDDVRKAVNKLKKGKSPGVDGITSEMLKCGGECLLEWLRRVCNVCLLNEKVPNDWMRAIIVPIYKGKGDRSDCRNYRGISLLSIPGKVYGRILIEKVRSMTEGLIGEEQCGFRSGRGCVDQVFVLKQMSEKCVDKNKSLYVAYMDLEKAYDRIDREAMWRVLGMYGINGQLMKAVQSLYEKSEACVRVCREEGDWFEVGVGLRQGCVMSPWLFNLFMDAVMKEVREKAGDVGVMLRDVRQNVEWKVEWLMFADDTVLVGDSEEKLERLVQEFGRVCQRRKLAVNVTKSKVMKVGKNGEENEMNVSLNNRRMEEVETYRYLGVDVSNDGGVGDEVNHRIGEAKKAWGALKDLWKKRYVSREAKVGMYEGIVEPSLLYGCEVWSLKVRDRKRIEAVEMECLRNICGVRRVDRVSNVEVRRRCGKNVSVGQRMDQGVLRWFGHVERMGDDRMAKRVYESDVRGVRRRGRPRKCWMDGVKEVLARKGLNIQEARVSVQDRNEWRSVCRGV